jgi:SNF2 family DNA or RNA helicase
MLKQPYKLYPHQEDALRWLERLPVKDGLRGGIVGFTMGMGKTLLGLIHAVNSSFETGKPTLVVCPKTVMYEWVINAEKFLNDDIEIIYLHTDFDKDAKLLTYSNIKDVSIVVTTYDSCTNAYRNVDKVDSTVKGTTLIMGEDLWKDKVVEVRERYNALRRMDTLQLHNKKLNKGVGYDLIYTTAWGCVIADESQRFANPKTKCYRAMLSILGDTKCCLTGTPIRNYETDVWAQLRFLGFYGADTAREWTRNKKRWLNNISSPVTKYILIKKYEDAQIEMPELELRRILVPFQTREEDDIYRLILAKAQQAFENFMRQELNFSHILSMFTRLRQVCIASYLLFPESKRKKSSYTKKEDVFSFLEETKTEKTLSDEHKLWLNNHHGACGMRSTKMNQIVSILRTIPKDEKVIIFSAFTSSLDLVKRAIEEENKDMEILSLDGSVTGLSRYLELRKFKENPQNNILLIHYKVGSEGLNLPEASHVIFIEPWWTDAIHNQALARAWRNGQKKKVVVYQIIIERTIEEKILSICYNKTNMVKSILGDSALPYKTSGLNASMMRDILYSDNRLDTELKDLSEKIEIMKLH